MNRRNFLGGIAALIGGVAIKEAVPLGRVWSFPSHIVIPQARLMTPEMFRLEALAILKQSAILSPYSLRAHTAPEMGIIDDGKNWREFATGKHYLRMDANDGTRMSGVDMRIEDSDMGMSITDFRERFGKPALAALEYHVQRGGTR